MGILPTVCIANEFATGSGFFITSDGNFVTNFHVIAGADSIVIRDVYGNTFPATIVRVDQSNDLAVLKVKGKFQPIPIENSTSVKRGTPVIVIGFPHIDVQGLEPKVTNGIISSLTGIQDDPKYFQISAEVQSGNSGGPLLNMYGNVVGIVSSKLGATEVQKSTGDLTQNVNYAVKSNYLLELASTLIQVKNSLKIINKKKMDDASGVYSNTQNSIGLVIAEHNNQKLISEDAGSISPDSNKTFPKEAPSQHEYDHTEALSVLSKYFDGNFICMSGIEKLTLSINSSGDITVNAPYKNKTWLTTIQINTVKKTEDYFEAIAEFSEPNVKLFSIQNVTLSLHADNNGVYKFIRYLNYLSPRKEDQFKCDRLRRYIE